MKSLLSSKSCKSCSMRFHWIAVAALCLSTGLTAAVAQTAEAPQFRVGDRWVAERSDMLTKIKDLEFVTVVTRISAAGVEGTQAVNNGLPAQLALSPEGNYIDGPNWKNTAESKFLSFPLTIGKTWAIKDDWTSKTSGNTGSWRGTVTVLAQERITVPAGEFETFKLQMKGFQQNNRGWNAALTRTYWYAPAVRTTVKTEFNNNFDRYVTVLTAFTEGQ